MRPFVRTHRENEKDPEGDAQGVLQLTVIAANGVTHRVARRP